MSCKTDPCSCLNCLNKCRFFQSLTRDELIILDSAKYAMSYEKGEHIVKQGSPPPHSVVIITEGYAILTIEGQYNRNFIIEVVKPVNILNLMFMSGIPVTPISLIALTNAKICYLDMDKCHDLLKQNSLFSYDLHMYMSQVAVKRFRRMSSIAIKQTRGKLADTLLYLGEFFNSDTIATLFSRKDLGDMANLSMENTIRTLKDFEREGMIRINKKEIIIINEPLLQKVSEKG